MALVCAGTASAQEMFRAQMGADQITASDFIGMRVYSAESAIDAQEYAGVQQGWNDIGEINDVVLNRDGRIDAVLVDIGGFLGMGERQVAVGIESIRFVADSATADAADDFFLVINADRSTLEGAPAYLNGGMASAGRADATSDGTGALATDTDATGNVVDDSTGDAVANTTGDIGAGTDGTVGTSGTLAREGYAGIDASGITGDQLRGVRVYGPNDEDLGEISDIVLTDAGAPARVIIDVGGFLGIGEKPVEIEMARLQIMQATAGGRYRAYLQMTQEELESMPTVQR